MSTNSQTGDHNFNVCSCNGCNCNNNQNNFKILSFNPQYSVDEVSALLIELKNLRKQNKILMDLCLPEKLEDAWNYGWQSRQFAEGNNSLELKNELWMEDKESIINDELENLEKENDGEFEE